MAALQIVAAWNGMAISAFAMASRVLISEEQPLDFSFPVEDKDPRAYMDAAVRVRSQALGCIGWMRTCARLEYCVSSVHPSARSPRS